jgi:flavorubredoxin
MKARRIVDDVYLLGAVDWDRRLFDALIPLPEGTSYNAYLVQGSEKTVLIDTVDPPKADVLLAQLAHVPKIDYIVAHHAEQDHSGAIPLVLEGYPEAKVICSPKAKSMLADHLGIEDDKFITVADGDELELGGKTLKFIHTPWVHWPETMSTYLPEDKILFSCDFFGSHLATSEMFADERRVYEGAKRYYAEIMMPFAKFVTSNLKKLDPYEIDFICPSHGPIYDRPAFIMDAYRDWAGVGPKNQAIIAYVSMHDSTKLLAEHLVDSLVDLGVGVTLFNLTETDLGKLATSLVDAATVVIGTPMVLGGAHPFAANAAFLTNALRPKVRQIAIIGSFGWGGKVADQLAGLLGSLSAEILPPVLSKGLPKEADFAAIDALARTIANRHAALGLK